MRNLTFALSLASVLVLAACGDDTGGAGGAGGSPADGPRPTCDKLGETCHDTPSDLGQECHEFGEDTSNTEDACKAREAECLAECEQAAGTTGATGASSTASGSSTASTGAG